MARSQGAAIESYVPGRVRVRLPRQYRSPSAISEIESMLGGIEGISDVLSNTKTGSVLVHYDPVAVDIERLMELGRAAGLIADLSEAMLGESDNGSWLEPSPAAKRVMEGFKTLNGGVKRVTRGAMDAKIGIPMLLLAMSLGRALLSEKRAAAPWHSLMWYAYSMFMHWNRPANGARNAV